MAKRDRVSDPDWRLPAVSANAADIFNLPLTEDYLVVDTRSAEEFAAAHLPTARSLPVPAAHAAAAGRRLGDYVAAWMEETLALEEPEQKTLAAVLGDPTTESNRAELSAIVIAIGGHPMFQHGRLRIRVCEDGHHAVASEYPFLSGKEWKDLPSVYPSQVQPGFFLGSVMTAKSRQVLEDLNIKAVVNAAVELSNFHEDDKALSISYLKLPLEDDPLQDLECELERALPFIAAALQGKGSVLVHCQMGQSRSVSVVVAHLMSTLGCGYEKALHLVRSARPAARPNEGFQQELRALEGRLIYGPKQ